MTTISPRRRRGGFSGRGLVLGFVCALIVVVVLVWRGAATNLLYVALSPVLSLRNALSNTQATQLRADLASTTLALADRNELYQENVTLKLELGRDAGQHSLLAAILMRPPGTPYDTFIIDAGAAQQVRPGVLVYASGNTAIGTISEVYTNTSRVKLFSSPDAEYPALIMLPNNNVVPITLEGQGSGSLTAQVPSATPVAVGESVVLPGIGSSFAGTVSAVVQHEGESFESVYVQLPANIFDLQFVKVAL